MGARSALAGTSTRVAAATGGGAPTACVPGDVTAAIEAIDDLSGARRGRSREVRAQKNTAGVHVLVATCRAEGGALPVLEQQ